MGFAGKTSFHGRKVRTQRDKIAAAANLIGFCTPERFVTLTADAVARHSGAPLATCEQMLATARERRG
jgi:hypothetical protein